MNHSELIAFWLKKIARALDNHQEPQADYYDYFLKHPQTAIDLLDILNNLKDDQAELANDYFACLLSFELCIAQLQTLSENNHKNAEYILNQIMNNLANKIHNSRQTLNFWLPVLQAFYKAHVELSASLKEAYLVLTEEAEAQGETAEFTTVDDLLSEYANLSAYEIADNFIAQSYAMPEDFFVELIQDLYPLPRGLEVAVLFLLHPRDAVKDLALEITNDWIDKIDFNSSVLYRLDTIRQWYPQKYQSYFDRWLKIYRLKGNRFSKVVLEKSWNVVQIKASEIDGSGAQGLFLYLRSGKKNRLCGLLFKEEVGIKDAWITPIMSTKDAKQYQRYAFDKSIVLRNVNFDYAVLIIEHFLGVTLQQKNIPDLQFLEIQELLAKEFTPRLLDLPATLNALAIQIIPFVPSELKASLKRSAKWTDNKAFAQSWFIESIEIDKEVTRYCTIEHGIKVCNLKAAEKVVLLQEFEPYRAKWLFHFIWVSLWLKHSAKFNEKIWQDSVMVAYVIQQNYPLESIPLIKAICHQTVVNSLSTMQERRTHLT